MRVTMLKIIEHDDGRVEWEGLEEFAEYAKRLAAKIKRRSLDEKLAELKRLMAAVELDAMDPTDESEPTN